MTDSVLYNELHDTNKVSTSATDAADKARDNAVYALATRSDAGTFFDSLKEVPAEAEAVKMYMRRQAVAGEVNQIATMEAPLDDRLARLRQMSESAEAIPADNSDIEAGILNNANLESGTLVSISDIRARKAENLSALTGELNRHVEDVFKRVGARQKTEQQLKVDRRGNPILKDGEKQYETVNKVDKRSALEVAAWAIVGTGSHEIANVINKYLPADGKGNRVTNAGGRLVEFRNYLEGLPEDEAKKVGREFAQDLYDRRGTIFKNDYTYVQNVEWIMANLDGTTSLGAVVDGLVSLAEAAGVIAPPLKGVKVVVGSIAKAMGTGKAGAEALVRAAGSATGERVVSATGTHPGAVIAEHVMPKIAGHQFDAGRHMVDIDLLDVQKVAKLQDDVRESLEGIAGTNKMNDVVLKHTDNGFEATVVLGTKKGNPFTSKVGAERVAKRIDGAKTVEVDGKWYVHYDESVRYGSDLLPDVVEGAATGGIWRTLFGRNVAFSGRINHLATQAELASTKEDALLKNILKPYSGLNKSNQTHVNKALVDGEKAGKWWSTDDLVQRLGDGPDARKLISAYKSVQFTAARVWNVRNTKLRDGMIQRGYRGLDFGGVHRIVEPVADAKGASKVLSLDGRVIAKPKEGHTYVKLLGQDAEKGIKFDIIAIPDGHALTNLPPFVLKKVDGYLPRTYAKPYYINKHTDEIVNGNKVSRLDDLGRLRNGKSIMTAGSRGDAEARLASLSENADEGVSYSVKQADEITGEVLDVDDISAAIRDGMLTGQARNPVALGDVIDDLWVPPPVTERIGKLVHSGSKNAGIARYMDTITAQLNTTFKDLGFKGIGKIPAQPKNIADLDRWKEGVQIVHHLRNMNGLGLGQSESIFRVARNNLADILYNNAAPGRFGALARAAGDEVSGLGTPISDAAKRATFAAYLLLNPVRQAVLQATMVPTYAGVNGGMTYLPRFFKDTAAWATGVGRTPELQSTIDAFKRSGLSELVENHIFDLGRTADAGIKYKSMASQGLNFAKRAGMDLGVGADKRGAFLFATNRFKTMNKKFPTTESEWKEISTFAEGMALNQNRSDTLLVQNGVASLVTQFLSHQIKMTGRIAGLEKQWERGERMKMFAASLMSYGTAGYGFHKVWDELKSEGAEMGINVPGPVDTAIQEGLIGMGVNMLFNAFNEDDPVKWAVSSGFSPTNFMGGYYDAVTSFGGSLLDGDFAVEMNPGFAAAGLLGDAADTFSFMARAFGVARQGSWTAEQYADVVLPEIITMFPLTNNMSKAAHAIEFGKLKNSSGQEIGSTPRFTGALAAIIGLRSQDELDLRVATERVFGEWESSDSDGFYNATDDQAKEDAKRYFSYIDRANLTKDEADDIIGKLWSVRERGFQTDGAWRRYRNTMTAQLRKYKGQDGQTLPQRIQDIYTKSARAGRIANEYTTVEWLRLQEFEGAKELADRLERRIIGTPK